MNEFIKMDVLKNIRRANSSFDGTGDVWLNGALDDLNSRLSQAENDGKVMTASYELKFPETFSTNPFISFIKKCVKKFVSWFINVLTGQQSAYNAAAVSETNNLRHSVAVLRNIAVKLNGQYQQTQESLGYMRFQIEGLKEISKETSALSKSLEGAINWRGEHIEELIRFRKYFMGEYQEALNKKYQKIDGDLDDLLKSYFDVESMVKSCSGEISSVKKETRDKLDHILILQNQMNYDLNELYLSKNKALSEIEELIRFREYFLGEYQESLNNKYQKIDGDLDDLLKSCLDVESMVKSCSGEISSVKKETGDKLDDILILQDKMDYSLKELSLLKSKVLSDIETLILAQAKSQVKTEELTSEKNSLNKKFDEISKLQSAADARFEYASRTFSKTEAELRELSKEQSKLNAQLDDIAYRLKNNESVLNDISAGQSKANAEFNTEIKNLTFAQDKTGNDLSDMVKQIQSNALSFSDNMISAQGMMGIKVGELSKEQLQIRLELEELNKMQSDNNNRLNSLLESRNTADTRLSELNEIQNSANLELKEFDDKLSRLEYDHDLNGILDYKVFEDKFRGSRENILPRMAKYASYFSEGQNVLDLGCGRGELLELLSSRGVICTGVDKEHSFAEECLARGFNVLEQDMFIYLESLRNNCLDGICAVQVVEHLSSRALIDLIRLCHTKLKMGGKLIIETQNPEVLTTYTRSFYIDLSHYRPVHPETLKHLLEENGYKLTVEDRTEFSRDMERRLPHIGGFEENEGIAKFNEGLDYLNDLLYGSIDYSVVAEKL